MSCASICDQRINDACGGPGNLIIKSSVFFMGKDAALALFYFIIISICR